MYTLLVAEDERWIRKGVIKMIDSQSMDIREILEADNIEDAFMLFKEKRPSIVISDVRFPIENGCILCERIYAHSPNTRFIMLSGYNDFEYVKRALLYKAVDYLLKPVDKNILNNTIKKCIDELVEQEQMKSQLPLSKEIEPKDQITISNIEEVIHQVMDAIKETYWHKFTLSEFALQYHLSEAYFSFVFKRISGVSLMTYIMQVRVEKAKELMITTNYKIWDIGEKVGYFDQHYFTKVFKKITGETPKEYKKSLEEELYGDKK